VTTSITPPTFALSHLFICPASFHKWVDILSSIWLLRPLRPALGRASPNDSSKRHTLYTSLYNSDRDRSIEGNTPTQFPISTAAHAASRSRI